ncbi:hypothetical protein Q2T42_27195 [Leptolyngbya boryana CZ1]|uniref:Uncharacterized protein n=2 Tax=Leptolyngbya boryana TaxID=1184 RepID=A0A1Z4JFX0_LEPBY|nr:MULTISPECIES: hypothetical protein [Leptolyngbya]BAY55631.1 hypothetical protein NIES2135_24550 [Leptolyngbya boryana NIES-2135]MBD2369989.1 hypothetical protein [Leptolyngbya sp. FACHB-161]MBD2376309.1 hypothetical protein [Leptolyngbya sp. FACHB-238]MBD2400584.1 hypothetical protein [Leptolyngbya sp. FACHB-239]MBD2407126.1 hypothetical protein [Leptolyngbya sp. FACHB-402]
MLGVSYGVLEIGLYDRFTLLPILLQPTQVRDGYDRYKIQRLLVNVEGFKSNFTRSQYFAMKGENCY